MHRPRKLTFVALCVLTLPTSDLNAASPVTLTKSEERPIVQIVTVSGTVTSPSSALLSPAIGGLVERINVDAGDRVAVGAVLVTLDRELASLAMDRATAEETQAQIALSDSRRRLREAEDVGPERGIAKSTIESLRAEVIQDEAALDATTAALSEQRAIVARHEIKAPFAGVVSRRIAQVGEWVAPGNGLVELVATDGLRFDFQVPQTYFAQIDADGQVSLRIDALPDQEIAGVIQAIVPVNDPGARTFLLRVVMAAGSNAAVTPGMSARATLRIDAGRRAVVVPRDAIIRYPDGRKAVWVAESNGSQTTVREQRVETGIEFDGLVEVRSGLTAGLAVVSRGNESLREGEVVTER
ncbi:MAG: efflux RND transporter periplasmic adaptor subunit [Pseudomonadota bacterium]